jgi:DNA-binding beta-propeller fold protein YncE
MLVAGLAGLLVFASSCWADRDAPTEGDPLAGPRAGEPELKTVLSESLQSPMRLDVTPMGRLLVSDPGNRSVVIVDPVTLEPGPGFRMRGKPLAVGLAGGWIFVGSSSERTVVVYDAEQGRKHHSFGIDATEYPTDLDIDPELELVFVVDGGAREVKVFDYLGTPRARISGPGTTEERLQAPTGIAVDPTRREVYVSDYGNPGGEAAVKIFDYEGSFLGRISGAGNCGVSDCSVGFSRPQGMDVDGQGRIYLADALLAQVLVIDRASMQVVETLGGRGAGMAGLRLPLDVAVGNDGNLFVTSNRSHSVEVFVNGVALR